MTSHQQSSSSNNSNNSNSSSINSNNNKKQKIFMLWVHDQQFSKEELVVNPEHFPKLKVGDILEISQPSNPSKKLCLRVKTLAPVKGQLQISIAKYIASVFDFVSRKEVVVNVIPDKSAIVDFVEVSFKDQYIGRSDMWRLKLSLQNECVYVLKKLSFAQVRAQVEEMVSKGQKVSSGLIDESTKFVFRSRSAKFILLIQMSKEMWDFASDGDLYFEKAVNGFLKSLFAKWKSLSVNHTVTIVLFSRTYYENSEILDEIPNLPKNKQGVLFQDFYKVIVSEETRQDWNSVIVNLKREFSNYHQMVNWDIYGRNSALGKNSTAQQGNFLEAINLGMSYFDKHYIDRDFTRTGQMIVVVSPGTGIFEVDPDVNLVTKQRMIDNGYGCDLICLNKHPLHIVPLFKYSSLPSQQHQQHQSSQQQQQQQSSSNQYRNNGLLSPAVTNRTKVAISQVAAATQKQQSQYNVPYWLAISFYDENSVVDPNPNNKENNNNNNINNSSNSVNNPANNNINNVEERFQPQFRMPEPSMSQRYYNLTAEKPKKFDFFVPKDPMKMAALANQKPPNKYTSHTLGVSSYEDTIFNTLPDRLSGDSMVSASTMDQAIVDDYVPSEPGTESEMSDGEVDSGHPYGGSTSNLTPTSSYNYLARKRSSLGAPLQIDPRGSLTKKIQISDTTSSSSYERQHHHQPLARKTSVPTIITTPLSSLNTSNSNNNSSSSTTPAGAKKSSVINPFTYDDTSFHTSSNRRRWSHLWFSPNTYIFGQTNANPNPFLPNWKSLCEPASLPITTDYFPSQKDLNTKYVEYSTYSLALNDENDYHNDTESLLKELISQRLAQGYQLIMEQTLPSQQAAMQSTSSTSATPGGVSGKESSSSAPPTNPTSSSSASSTTTTPTKVFTLKSSQVKGNKRVYQLSLGHDFHVLSYDPSNPTIQIKRYQRHTVRNKPSSIKYTYYLCTVYHDSFIPRVVTLSHQQTGQYAWNNLDNLICSCGTLSTINRTLKYWTVQYAVVPLSLVSNTGTNSESDGVNSHGTNHHTSSSSSSSSSSTAPSVSVGLGLPIPGTISPPPPQLPLPPPPHQFQSNNSTNISALLSPPQSPNASSNSIPLPPSTSHSSIATSQPIPPPPQSTVHLLQPQPPSTTHNSNHPLQQILTSSVSAPTSPVSSHKAKHQAPGSMQHGGIVNTSQLKLAQSATTSPNTSQEISSSNSEPPTMNNSTNILNMNPAISTQGQFSEQTEEERMASFTKFKEYINSLISKNTNQKEAIKMEVKMLSHGQYQSLENEDLYSLSGMGNVSNIGPSFLIKERLNPSNLQSIFTRMNMNPPIGLKLSDRKHRLRSHRRCFVGSEVVDWIIQNVDLSTISLTPPLMSSSQQLSSTSSSATQPNQPPLQTSQPLPPTSSSSSSSSSQSTTQSSSAAFQTTNNNNANLNSYQRDQAIAVAQRLFDEKYFKTIDKTQFADGLHYYRLREDDQGNLLQQQQQQQQQILQQQQQQQQNIKRKESGGNRSLLTNSDGNDSQQQQNTSLSFVINQQQQKTSNTEPSSPKITSTTSPVLNEYQQQQLTSALQSPTQSPKIVNNNNNGGGGRQGLQMSASFLESSFSPSHNNNYNQSEQSSLRNSMGVTPPILNHLHMLSPTNLTNHFLQHTTTQPTTTSTILPQPNTNSNAIETYENPNRSDEEKIDMDSTKTDRYEWILVKHDKTFTPSRYFHFEFKWMVCTGCVVDDFISSCIRRAKQFGLTLIQIPIEKNYSPFYAPIHIKLVPKLMQTKVIGVILKKLNFIPDHISRRPSSLMTKNDLYIFTEDDFFDTEYIHRTGMLFVRIVEDGFLCIINNAPSNRAFLPAALLCLKGFQDLVAQLNSTMPSIIYSADLSSQSFYDDSVFGGSGTQSASPQTSLLRSLPPGEANFLSLFTKGYTASSHNSHDYLSDVDLPKSGGSRQPYNKNQRSGLLSSSEEAISSSEDELYFNQNNNNSSDTPSSSWERRDRIDRDEILYYSVMSRSPTI